MFLQHLDFVGYLIDSNTNTTTETSVYIGDVIDRDASVLVNNCTKLVCKPRGVTKEKVPCKGKRRYF